MSEFVVKLKFGQMVLVHVAYILVDDRFWIFINHLLLVKLPNLFVYISASNKCLEVINNRVNLNLSQIKSTFM